MNDALDARLLEQFARNQSEAAFAELVRRHISLVYSVAFRKMGNPQQAEDVTQAVFIIMARKADSLGSKTVLAGWLYHTARLTAANAHRADIRRIRREQEAIMQYTDKESAPDAFWSELSPLLEDAMAGIGASERDAIVLRYFQNLSLADVGAALGITECAAQRRVSRALEKFRRFFARRGVHSTTAIIAGAISANSVQAAPAGLTGTISAMAVAKGTGASASSLTFVKGALKIMAWTKAKTAAGICVGILLAAGTTTVTVKAIQRHSDSQWDVGQLNSGFLRTAPHIVRIVPSKFPDLGGWVGTGRGSMLGFGLSARDIIGAAYQTAQYRTIVLAALPPGRYDFIANLPRDSVTALQRELEKRFRIIARTETIETNVLFLRFLNSNAPGLRPNTTRDASHYGAHSLQGQLSMNNGPMTSIANFVEVMLGNPVIEQTSLTGNYDATMKWDYQNDPRNQKLKQALKEQLGLELVPGTAPIEMLVVEKAK